MGQGFRRKGGKVNVYKTRQEHDLFKLLAKDFKELSKLLENQPQAREKLKEVIGLIDGYFITSRERTREEDI